MGIRFRRSNRCNRCMGQGGKVENGKTDPASLGTSGFVEKLRRDKMRGQGAGIWEFTHADALQGESMHRLPTELHAAWYVH